MLSPWPTVKTKRKWKIQAAGPVVSLTFTPGGGHIVAVVQSGASGQARDLQVFEKKTSQEVVLEPQENRPPSYHASKDSQEGNVWGSSLGVPTSASHYALHPGGGFEESIVRPDVGGSRLNVVDLFYPSEEFENPEDALVTKLQNVQFPIVISPTSEVLPGCDEVFAGVDTADKGMLRVYSWSADEHLLRERRCWNFPNDEITHLEFTRDGRRIVCLTKKKYYRVVDLTSEGQFGIPVTTKHEPEMLRTYQSRDGRIKVAVSVWQDVVVVGNYDRGQTEIYSLSGAVGSSVRALCLTKECDLLACATDNGIDLFQPRTRKVVQKGLGRGLVDIRTGSFSDDGGYLAVADSGGNISLLKLSRPQWAK